MKKINLKIEYKTLEEVEKELKPQEDYKKKMGIVSPNFSSVASDLKELKKKYPLINKEIERKLKSFYYKYYNTFSKISEGIEDKIRDAKKEVSGLAKLNLSQVTSITLNFKAKDRKKNKGNISIEPLVNSMLEALKPWLKEWKGREGGKPKDKQRAVIKKFVCYLLKYLKENPYKELTTVRKRNEFILSLVNLVIINNYTNTKQRNFSYNDLNKIIFELNKNPLC